jgi:hypothetical protein
VLDGVRLDVGEGLVLSEGADGVLHVVVTGGVYLIDGPEVLRPDFVDDVWAVGFVPLLLLEKAQLPGLAELRYTYRTSLRLLLRFQLSSPREERGPCCRAVSFM